MKDENLSEHAEVARFYFSWIKYLIALIAILACLWVVPKNEIITGVLIAAGIVFLFLALPFALLQYIWVSIETGSYLRQAKRAGISTLEQKRNWSMTLIFLAITQALGLVVATFMILGFSNVKLPAGIEIMAVVLIAGVLMIPTQCVSMAYLAKLEVKQPE